MFAKLKALWFRGHAFVVEQIARITPVVKTQYVKVRGFISHKLAAVLNRSNKLLKEGKKVEGYAMLGGYLLLSALFGYVTGFTLGLVFGFLLGQTVGSLVAVVASVLFIVDTFHSVEVDLIVMSIKDGIVGTINEAFGDAEVAAV